jgi:hypothetical protein
METPEAKPVRPPITLRVQRAGLSGYEIREGERLVGAFDSEVKALWTAVDAAESLAVHGQIVRVVAVRGGKETVEFVAVPLP